MRQRALVPTLVLVTLMASLISSLGAPLIPTIAASNHVSLTAAQWSLTLTLLVGAIATPVVGRLGDGPRRRRVLLSVLAAVFTGSLLAALPFGFAALLVGRGLQGLGLSLLPLTMAVARDNLDPERSRSTVALLAVTGVGGVGLGYPVTGVIAEHGGVHGAFWFGTGFSGLTLLCAFLVLPSSRRRTALPLDVVGAVLVGLGFASLLIGLSNLSRWGATSPRLLASVTIAAVLLAVWVPYELRHEHPLIDLRLLRHREVLLADVSGVLSGIGMYLLMSMCILLAQTPTSAGYGIGASVAVGGLILLPLSIGTVSSSRLVPALSRRMPLDRLLPIGTVVVSLGVVLFLFAHHSLWQLMLVLGVVGLGVGLTTSVMPALILRSVPAHETGSATGFNQVLRTAGYASGSALSTTILQAHTPTGSAFPTESGYVLGALVGLALCAVTLAVVLPLLPRHERRQSGLDSATDQLLRAEALADGLSEQDSAYAHK